MITVIGEHRVRCGSVMDNLDELMQGETVDVFYSDPPWGQGNLSYWQTLNKKMTGAEPQSIELTAFIKRVFEVAVKYCTGPVIIEYGVRWKESLVKAGQDQGLTHYGHGEAMYRSGSRMLPLHVHVFGGPGLNIPAGYFEGLAGTYAMATLRSALGPFKGASIMDPCCGMGYTAQYAVEHSMKFRGNELNAARLEKTKARLVSSPG